MIPMRWLAAGGRVCRPKPGLKFVRRNGSACWKRNSFRPRVPNPRLRIQGWGSRVREPLDNEYASLRREHIFSTPPHLPHLQSGFPKKTALAVLVIAGILYWAVDVVVEDEVPFPMRLLDILDSDITAFPFHHYKNREEVDQMVQHAERGNSSEMDVQLLQQVNDHFERMIGGWMMSEDDAREWNLPVTHGCRLTTNEPCEDHYSIGSGPGPGSAPWNFWGVYDGHAGKHTANYLQSFLIPFVSRDLSTLPLSSPASAIASTIMQTFVRLDDDMMVRAKHAANWAPAASASAIFALTRAFSGSCALLSMYDPENYKLHVACVGDSRAVLGRWDPDAQKYVCKALSVDQTGFNQDEVSRITAEHPDEPDILNPNTGRLLGMAVTRAFGDHRWKWDNDFIRQLQFKFWGSAPRPESKTPPYMTAEPVVTETDIVSVDADSEGKRGVAGDKSDFMIMASDGLWDRISSEHAVELVERWIEARDRGNGAVTNDPRFQFPVISDSVTRQLDPGLDYSVEDGGEVDWQATPEYFSIEDDNAAVCLVRNALGGSRKGLFMGVLSVPGPLARKAVDDTTVMVVFFDKVEKREGRAGSHKQKEKEKKRWWPW